MAASSSGSPHVPVRMKSCEREDNHCDHEHDRDHDHNHENDHERAYHALSPALLRFPAVYSLPVWECRRSRALRPPQTATQRGSHARRASLHCVQE